jgi:hypothetical protein
VVAVGVDAADDRPMTFLWVVIAVLLAAVWVITLVDLFRRHVGMGKTAAWVLIVVLLPFLGSMLYWLLRKPSEEEVQRQIDIEQDMRRGGGRPPLDGTRVSS